MKLDESNQRFGFFSDRLGELIALVEKVTASSVVVAFGGWLQSQGHSSPQVDEDECEPFVEEFADFANGLREAISRGDGIIW